MMKIWTWAWKRRKPGRTFRYVRPGVEQLGARITPTAFTWKGGDPNNQNGWSDPMNWTGSNGMNYPGWDGMAATTNDSATFSNNVDCTLTGLGPPPGGGAPATLGNLMLKGFTGKLTMMVGLTVSQGSMDGGSIIQGTSQVGAPLTVTGSFTWSGGDINASALQAYKTGQFTIQSGATVTFSMTQAVGFGDDLTNKGTLNLSNTGGILLYNRPQITNTGFLYIKVDDAAGLGPALNDVALTIQNSGTIDKTGGSTVYAITNAVNNNSSTAVLSVDSGQLMFFNADPTTGYSINQSAGEVAIRGGDDLIAWSGLSQTGGLLQTVSAGKGYLVSLKKAANIGGGTLQVGDTSTTADLVVLGDLTLASGTVQVYYDTNGQTSSTLTATGTTGITITKATTTLAVTFFGTGNMPNAFDVMTARFGKISDVCGTNPTGYNASITNTNTYHLQKAGTSPSLLPSPSATPQADARLPTVLASGNGPDATGPLSVDPEAGQSKRASPVLDQFWAAAFSPQQNDGGAMVDDLVSAHQSNDRDRLLALDGIFSVS